MEKADGGDSLWKTNMSYVWLNKNIKVAKCKHGETSKGKAR